MEKQAKKKKEEMGWMEDNDNKNTINYKNTTDQLTERWM
jgi:hypothetical protein